MDKDEKSFFSVSEVGALIKAFRGDLGAIASEVRGLLDWRGRIESKLENIETRLLGVEDAAKIALPGIFKRLARLEAGPRR